VSIGWKSVWSAACCGVLVVASAAWADVTGSYDGSLVPKKSTETIAVSAVLSQSEKVLAGTMALPATLESFGGPYLLTGKATKRRVKVKGTGIGGKLRYRAKLVGTTLQGKLKVKGAGGKLRGALVLALNPPLGDGSGCDGVFTANETFFVDQVLPGPLQPCGSCHAPGLQAGATRLHVDASDPLGTARLIAELVDPVTPSASRILEKPLEVLPHGGGQQIVPGSAAEQTLAAWVELVAAAGCN
jgi:hypothetical protein